MPALHLAAGADDATGVGALIAGGADVDATDPVRPRRLRPCAGAVSIGLTHHHHYHHRAQDGRTALMLAAEKNASAAAKLLIEAKADLDATNKVRPVGVHACAEVH